MAVMDVIGFLCVSQGSSFVTVEVADSHAHVQRLVSVVKMATVLEEYNTEEQRPVMRFLWAKGLTAEDIHKQMLPVYGGKCLSHKAVHNLVTNVSLMTKNLKRRCGSG
jgi:hypothetical protein